MSAVIYVVEEPVQGFGGSDDLSRQRDVCCEACEELDVGEVDEYVERGDAASQPIVDREMFGSAISALRDGDRLVVPHRRRVAKREGFDRLERKVFGAGATLVSADEGVEYTPGGSRSLRVASIGKRILGGLVDLVAMFAAMCCFSVFTGIGNQPGPNRVGFSLEGWPFLAVATGIFVVLGLLEGRTGKSPGKYFFGTHIRDDDGGEASYLQALGRNLMRFVDFIAFGLVGLIPMLFTDQPARFGDLVAGTRVYEDVDDDSW